MSVEAPSTRVPLDLVIVIWSLLCASAVAAPVRIKDLAEDESAAILNFLYAHMVRDEFTCRFQWTPGAVAIWDNRVTMHRAINDYDGARRVMHRVTIGGDRPVAAAASASAA